MVYGRDLGKALQVARQRPRRRLRRDRLPPHPRRLLTISQVTRQRECARYNNAGRQTPFPAPHSNQTFPEMLKRKGGPPFCHSQLIRETAAWSSTRPGRPRSPVLRKEEILLRKGLQSVASLCASQKGRASGAERERESQSAFSAARLLAKVVPWFPGATNPGGPSVVFVAGRCILGTQF